MVVIFILLFKSKQGGEGAVIISFYVLFLL